MMSPSKTPPHLRLTPLLCGGLLSVLAMGCDSEGRDAQGWDPGGEGEFDSDGAQDSDGADGADGADDAPLPTDPIQEGEFGGLRQSVRISTNKGNCTGILLNPYTVLTAAHCVGPVVNLEWGVVETADDAATIDRARVWV